MDIIKEDLRQFINNPNFVYKSCQKEWLVVLEKIHKTSGYEGHFTETNEEREVYDPNYAKYRGSRFKVIAIINKFDPTKKINSIRSSCSGSVVYKVGEIVESDSFDPNPSNIFSNGIHYFKTFEPAYYYELDSIQKGLLKEWDDNGCIWRIVNYKDGKIDGEYSYFYKNGKIYKKYHYKNGHRDGEFTSWLDDGTLSEKYNYKNGERVCEYMRKYENGILFKNSKNEKKNDEYTC